MFQKHLIAVLVSALPLSLSACSSGQGGGCGGSHATPSSTVASASCCGGGSGCRCSHTAPGSMRAPMPTSAADRTAPPVTQAVPNSAPMAPSNALCPVMGQPIDPSVATSLYKGKVVGFCCAGCKPAFDASPDAYASKLP